MELAREIQKYLICCEERKKLNVKTGKAYRIDLSQFLIFMESRDGSYSRSDIAEYIALLHQQYKPRSVKRKIASLKAFFNYLEYEEIYSPNPFSKLKVKFQEPVLLPRTIPLGTIQKIFQAAYDHRHAIGLTQSQQQMVARDIAVLEMLFATGMRVSELCTLRKEDVDLSEGTVWIYGKGAKERMISIENQGVLGALQEYAQIFSIWIDRAGDFFLNRRHNRLSDQSVRQIITKYAALAGISLHITPHMFRHSFATLLLEEDVDIRYIQRFLGHSSITTTQIYTYVSANKQRAILTAKHPRNKITL